MQWSFNLHLRLKVSKPSLKSLKQQQLLPSLHLSASLRRPLARSWWDKMRIKVLMKTRAPPQQPLRLLPQNPHPPPAPMTIHLSHKRSPRSRRWLLSTDRLRSSNKRHRNRQQLSTMDHITIAHSRQSCSITMVTLSQELSTTTHTGTTVCTMHPNPVNAAVDAVDANVEARAAALPTTVLLPSFRKWLLCLFPSLSLLVVVVATVKSSCLSLF